MTLDDNANPIRSKDVLSLITSNKIPVPSDQISFSTEKSGQYQLPGILPFPDPLEGITQLIRPKNLQCYGFALREPASAE